MFFLRKKNNYLNEKNIIVKNNSVHDTKFKTVACLTNYSNIK